MNCTVIGIAGGTGSGKSTFTNRLKAAFGDDIYLSLMSQYTPMYRAREFPKLGRRLTTFEYESVTDYAAGLGFTRCFVQERSSADAAYVPDWDDAGVF